MYDVQRGYGKTLICAVISWIILIVKHGNISQKENCVIYGDLPTYVMLL